MKKKFDNLDKDFDRAMQRVDTKQPLIKNPYGTDPLAADHFLLAKGWTYFNERVQMIEEQWDRIAKAKDEQIKILDLECENLKSQLAEFNDKDKSESALSLLVRDLHLGEYVDIKKKTENVAALWEEERQRLNERIINLETQLKNRQDLLNKRNASFALREAEFLKQLKNIELKNAVTQEQSLASQKGYLAALKSKDDELQSLYAKIELLTLDVSRKNQNLKEMDEEKNKLTDQNKDFVFEIHRLKEVALERDREIIHLKTLLDIKEKEIAGLRSDMARQQAEWRELWDRSRETFR